MVPHLLLLLSTTNSSERPKVLPQVALQNQTPLQNQTALRRHMSGC